MWRLWRIGLGIELCVDYVKVGLGIGLCVMCKVWDNKVRYCVMCRLWESRDRYCVMCRLWESRARYRVRGAYKFRLQEVVGAFAWKELFKVYIQWFSCPHSDIHVHTPSNVQKRSNGSVVCCDNYSRSLKKNDLVIFSCLVQWLGKEHLGAHKNKQTLHSREI